jgi:hypothetical protein
MTIRPSLRIAAALGTTALVGLGPAGLAGAFPIDYSKNSVGGQYAPSRASAPAIDYSKNAAGGTFAPATSSPPAPSTSSASSSDDGGVDWGTAIAGAGAGFLIAFTAMGGRTVARRRRVVTG